MSHKKLLKSAAEVFCPNYPVRVSSPLPDGWHQISAYSVDEVVDSVYECGKKGRPGFVSVYSFPRGHTSDEGENVPDINTLYFDVDRDQTEDDGTPAGWARDMSALLVRARMVAQKLVEMDKDHYWRVSLSGHKGVHLYLDFDTIDVANGNENQFRNGMREYTEGMIESLEASTGLSLTEYIDVSSGKDLARLTRLPNSIHPAATERFGETRFCVPVSVKELAQITPEKYIKLTRHPRPVPDMARRIKNEHSHEVITRMVRMASGSGSTRSGSSGGGYNTETVLEAYEEQKAKEEVTLQLLEIHLKQKPCIWEFRENPDAFKLGNQSHIMEMNVISAMKNLRAPVSVMHDFFCEMDGYSEADTDDRIAAVVQADMATSDDDPDEQYRGLNCETIISDAPSFCVAKSGTGDCRIWDSEFADSKIPN